MMTRSTILLAVIAALCWPAPMVAAADIFTIKLVRFDGSNDQPYPVTQDIPIVYSDRRPTIECFDPDAGVFTCQLIACENNPPGAEIPKALSFGRITGYGRKERHSIKVKGCDVTVPENSVLVISYISNDVLAKSEKQQSAISTANFLIAEMLPDAELAPGNRQVSDLLFRAYSRNRESLVTQQKALPQVFDTDVKTFRESSYAYNQLAAETEDPALKQALEELSAEHSMLAYAAAIPGFYQLAALGAGNDPATIQKLDESTLTGPGLYNQYIKARSQVGVAVIADMARVSAALPANAREPELIERAVNTTTLDSSTINVSKQLYEVWR